MVQSLDFVIRGNTYKVNFPNNGQLKDIELLKVQLTNGRYGQMMQVNTVDSLYALDMVDTEAYITVLAPGCIKVPFNDLSIEDALEMRKAYEEQLLPFIKKWQDIINEVYKKSIKKKDDKKD